MQARVWRMKIYCQTILRKCAVVSKWQAASNTLAANVHVDTCARAQVSTLRAQCLMNKLIPSVNYFLNCKTVTLNEIVVLREAGMVFFIQITSRALWVRNVTWTQLQGSEAWSACQLKTDISYLHVVHRVHRPRNVWLYKDKSRDFQQNPQI